MIKVTNPSYILNITIRYFIKIHPTKIRMVSLSKEGIVITFAKMTLYSMIR